MIVMFHVEINEHGLWRAVYETRFMGRAADMLHFLTALDYTARIVEAD